MTTQTPENPLVMVCTFILGSTFGFIEYAGDLVMSILLGIGSAFGVWVFNEYIKPFIKKKWKKSSSTSE